jgi:hypothetical protein
MDRPTTPKAGFFVRPTPEPAASGSPGPPRRPVESPSRHWRRFTACLVGSGACWSLAAFWPGGKFTGAAIGAIAGMVIAFIGGDSASKFAPPKPPGPPRKLP